MKFAFPVHFAYNDATVRTEDAAALDRFANIVSKHYNGAKVTVEGFADPAGSSRYNVGLSQRRAEAVKAYVSSKGLDASLINTVGYGETRQVTRGASGDQPGAELNRRVVFVIESPANADANRVTASLEQ
jgi:peptidoglycan-associated lipoprotein